jgi:hypothetical protein
MPINTLNTEPVFTQAQNLTGHIVSFSDYKFRCSSVGYLISEGITEKQLAKIEELETKKTIKGLTEKQQIDLDDLIAKRDDDSLSETAKTYLQELFIEEFFGRRKLLDTPAMQKGTSEEQASIDLLNRIFNSKYIKNEEKFDNDFVCGTPDIIGKETILDIKTSRDIFSYFKSGVTKVYKYQLISYCWLVGKEKSKLAYCLVNTPENEIVRQMGWYLDDDKKQEQVRINNQYDDIDDRYKVTLFDVNFDLEKETQKIKKAVSQSRLYLNAILENTVKKIK